MKQIALVLLFTALAAGAFVVTRQLTRPQTPANSLPTDLIGREIGADVAAPQAQRPQISTPSSGAAATTGGTAVDQELIIGDALREEIERRENFPWQTTTGQGLTVLPSEAWRVDLSGVDFTDEVLFERNGLAITRADWQRFAMLELGVSLIDAAQSRELSLVRAQSAGVDATFTPEEHDRLLTLAAEKFGLDVPTYLARGSMEARLPVEAVRKLREMAIETVVGYMIGLEPGQQAPLALETFLAAPDARAYAETISQKLGEAMAAAAAARSAGEAVSDETLRAINAAVEGLTIAQDGARQSELAFRSWSYMDDELPEAAVAAIDVGELPDPVADDLTAPWEMRGDVRLIEVAPLWELLGEGLARQEQERLLHDLIFMRVLEGDLGERGVLPDKTEIWKLFIEEHEAGQRAAFPMGMVRLEMEGYPSFPQLRRMMRLQVGFERSLPPDWGSEANLRPFFESNRFFIEFWQLQLSMALFPASNPGQANAAADWEASYEAAKQMVEEVRGGSSFDVLRQQQFERLRDGIQDSQGIATAEAFAGLYGSRIVGGSINQLSEMLGHTSYRGLVDCYGIPSAAAASLGPGETSDPWRTGIGHVVVQLVDAVVGGLESEFEDLEFGTRSHYLNANFKRFANTTLERFLAGS